MCVASYKYHNLFMYLLFVTPFLSPSQKGPRPHLPGRRLQGPRLRVRLPLRVRVQTPVPPTVRRRVRRGFGKHLRHSPHFHGTRGRKRVARGRQDQLRQRPIPGRKAAQGRLVAGLAQRRREQSLPLDHRPQAEDEVESECGGGCYADQ